MNNPMTPEQRIIIKAKNKEKGCTYAFIVSAFLLIAAIIGLMVT